MLSCINVCASEAESERETWSGWKDSLCHVELASTVRDEERSYTTAEQRDREGSQPLSTEHSLQTHRS